MPDIQQQIAELHRKLENLELLQATLGEAAYLKAKTDLEAQLQPVISAADDTVFLNASADHDGKIVGRDDYSTTITNPDQCSPEDLLTF